MTRGPTAPAIAGAAAAVSWQRPFRKPVRMVSRGYVLLMLGQALDPLQAAEDAQAGLAGEGTVCAALGWASSSVVISDAVGEPRRP